jgi:VIT1/CCC1 family predicted Fe2+/Mn2+ transporter
LRSWTPLTPVLRRARRWTLPLSLGVSDGILNALVLATAAILHGAAQITVSLALRVGCVAFVTAVVTIFIAEYAELRSRLSRAARQLSLSGRGQLAATNLGRRVRSEAIEAGLVASLSSFAGAALPLLIAGLLPAASWAGLVVALILLGVLGAALATSVQGSRRRWTAGLIMAGAVVAAIGSQLNIT